jgi:prepilin-type processing-associated H-X9-DG protein
VQFSWISNELGTAKILACPSDDGKVARDFSSNPSSGLLYPTFRNNAVSYFVGHPPLDLARGLLCGDRNLAVSSPSGSCAYFPQAASIIVSPSFFGEGWTTSIHNNSGNILASDGHVESLSDAGLSSYLNQNRVDDNGVFHLLMPR